MTAEPGTDARDEGRAARRFLVIALSLAAVMFFAPVPNRDVSARASLIEASPARLAIVGPSTVDYTSPCDADHRDLADMLGAARGAPALDLSEGGQPMGRTLEYAGLIGARGAARDIVLPLSFRGLDDLAAPTWREYAYMRWLNPGLDVLRGADAKSLWAGANGRLGRQFEAFEFEGLKYPDYWKLLDGWFKREGAAKSCPEISAVDPAMSRAYYWWTHTMAEPNPRIIELIADLRADLARRGRRLHTFLLPTNLEYIGSMDAAWPAVILRKRDAFVAGFAQHGIPFLDLTELLPSSEFSTRWCACVHLTDAGRAKVVARLSAFMDASIAAEAR